MNPLLQDRNVDFLLDEVFALDELFALEAFAEHSRDTAQMYLESCRSVARKRLFSTFLEMDRVPPSFEDGQVRLHPEMNAAYSALVDLGVLRAMSPEEVGGVQMPFTVAALAHGYLMAANIGAYALAGLTTGAARLIESFGNDTLKRTYMNRMYDGTWTGTMALTEPQAGSSLADVQSTATLADDGSYRLRGTKVFISGGDHDIRDNIVHLTLARIEKAPAGIKGVSLFVMPKRRFEDGQLVDNDVHTSSVFHKIGWRSLPSVQLSFGDSNDCHGFLVGEPHQGIRYMFQMMNEARLMVGFNAIATASVAYLQSLEYARDRPQGRRLEDKDPATPQIPIVEHADVRRMLLRQKSIVEGGLALLTYAGKLADLAEHGASPEEREQSSLLLDLMTPIAKTFPAEYGFESTTLAIQIHGGYGYTTEYPPETWWRDQKLNSIHEGTTSIQGLDLLGRKVVARGGAALAALGEAMQVTIARAGATDLDPALADALEESARAVSQTVMILGQRGLAGDIEGMLRHSHDFMELMSVVVIAWMWLEQAHVAQRRLEKPTADEGFYRGKLSAARYWFATELPRATTLAARIESGEDSFAAVNPDWL